MTSTLIEITSLYVLKTWNQPCKSAHVLNLDSTTDVKFSRHLVFNVPGVAFVNNFHMGIFVKKICSDLVEHLLYNTPNDILQLFKKEQLQGLFVDSDKGKKIFVDTTVYSRNRHFRILGSTKWGKKSHLVVSPESKYVSGTKNQGLRLFLDSLISHFAKKSALTLLQFDDTSKISVKYNFPRSVTKVEDCVVTCRSQYPLLDRFVSDLVKPGKIRSCRFYESSKTIKYDVAGNRYAVLVAFCGMKEVREVVSSQVLRKHRAKPQKQQRLLGGGPWEKNRVSKML